MRRKYVIWLHLAFWLLLILNHSIPLFRSNPYQSYKGQTQDLTLFIKYFLIETGFCSISALCFYANYWLVAPLLFVRKKYLLAIAGLIGIVAGVTTWRYIVEFGLFKPVLGFDNYRGDDVTFKYYVTNVFFYYFPGYFIYGLMYFFWNAGTWISKRGRN
jgi:two-component system LytT family sensor kinase